MNKLVIAIAILAAAALALSLYKGGLHAPKDLVAPAGEVPR
ncbi:hypothetical protein [Haloferula sp. BvORR071]|nr:hypothetical protein [Haloferula sp. BvORR071]